MYSVRLEAGSQNCGLPPSIRVLEMLGSFCIKVKIKYSFANIIYDFNKGFLPEQVFNNIPFIINLLLGVVWLNGKRVAVTVDDDE